MSNSTNSTAADFLEACTATDPRQFFQYLLCAPTKSLESIRYEDSEPNWRIACGVRLAELMAEVRKTATEGIERSKSGIKLRGLAIAYSVRSGSSGSELISGK